MGLPTNNTFALIGAAGYIAPRHMKAIAETGNILVAAMDKSDSVGIMDRYFPDASFFTEFERFDRYLNKLKTPVDFLTVCTPNHLHDAHIRYGLRLGSNVICEKPMVINPWNLSGLSDIEKESSRKIYNILQLRLHPEIKKLKEQINVSSKTHEVNLTYITTRGKWYYTSWKGDLTKSGGIATNIGIHFFDLLTWIFGEKEYGEVHVHTHDRAGGYFEFKKAKVKWFLSINSNFLPKDLEGGSAFRRFTVDDLNIDLNYNFERLHTESYKEILAGRGFRLEDSQKSIELASEVRTENPIGINNNAHIMSREKLTQHPFKKQKD